MYKTALFIGRFQPFHMGHLYSLKRCLEIAERLVIAVGSSQESGTENNPWDYKVRKRMVCEVVREMGIENRVARICSCPDYPSDARWLREVVRRAGEFDVAVSNNEWTLRVLAQAGYQVKQSGLYNREELEGLKIRELMRGGRDEWKERVPEEVVRLFENNEIEMIRSIY